MKKAIEETWTWLPGAGEYPIGTIECNEPPRVVPGSTELFDAFSGWAGIDQPDRGALAAAAPELYRALAALLDEHPCACGNALVACAHDGALAALAKARGES